MENNFGRFLGILLFIAAVALFGLVVMFLWNGLLPEIFGLPAINYWQAAGLLILVRILFGGIDGGLSHRFTRKNLFRDKWHGMNEVEREAFRKRHHHNSHDRYYDHLFTEDKKNNGNDNETKKE